MLTLQERIKEALQVIAASQDEPLEHADDCAVVMFGIDVAQECDCKASLIDKAWQTLRDGVEQIQQLGAKVEAQAAELKRLQSILNIEDLRRYCHATFNGGWQEHALYAFHTGMDTVCNLLADEMEARSALASRTPEETKEKL